MKSELISVRGPIRAINVFFPRVERCVQFAYEFRMLRGQIVPLARVRRDVEEVEVGPILEQLPATGPDCPLLAWTFDPPEDLALDDWRGLAQRRKKIDSVEFVAGWDRRAGEGHNRCRQIH